MRLPWLQVDQDGLTRCRLLARLLGVPETQGIGIGMALWQWALEIAPEGDFRGLVPDSALVPAAVGWDVADGGRLMTELQRVGMLATAPELRVRGLDRYRRAWEKNRRKPVKPATSGGRVPETGASSAGNRAEPARQTQTQTQTDTKAKLPTPKKPAPAKSVDPRHAPLVVTLCATFEAIKRTPYPFGGGRDAKAVAGLLAKAEPEVINHAWARALREATHPPIACIYELEPKLAHFIGGATHNRGTAAPGLIPTTGNSTTVTQGL